MLSLYFPISALINLITSLIVSLVVIRNFRNPINRTFFLFSLSVAFWSLFYFLWQISDREQYALNYCKLFMIGAIFIPPTFFHFTINLIERSRDYSRAIFIFYFLGFIFLLFDLTPFLVNSVQQKMIFKYFPNPGPIYLPYLCFFGTIVSWSLLLLFKYYENSKGVTRNKIKYVFLGTGLGFLGGITNYPLWFNIQILPLGNVFVSLYVFLIAFAIIKYRLMDIRLAISNTAIFICIYTLVLGLPFYLYFNGYKLISLFYMAYFASTGPFFYSYVRKKAEDKIFKEQLEYQEDILDFSKKISQLKTIDEICQGLVEIIYSKMKLKNIALYLAVDDEFKLKTVLGDLLRIPNKFNKNNEITSFLINVGSFFTDEINYQKHPSLCFLKDYPNKFIIPIVHNQKILALLMLGEKDNQKHYSDSDINVLNIVANNAALVIENALFNTERDKLLNENFQKSRFESLALLCTSISHQMNNRFQSIINRIFESWETFQEGKHKELSKEELLVLYEEFGESVNRVMVTAEDGAKITKAILDFSKSKVDFGVVSFDDAVNKSVEFIQLKRANCQIDLVKDYPQDILLWAAQAPLHDIIANAIDNSWFAMNQKLNELKISDYHPQITIRGYANSTMFHFEIEDNGLGIKKENLNRILDPMFTTKGNKDGTGMGTTVMLQFIQKHGGSISYESEYEKWTKVKISLPLATEAQKGSIKNV